MIDSLKEIEESYQASVKDHERSMLVKERDRLLCDVNERMNEFMAKKRQQLLDEIADKQRMQQGLGSANGTVLESVKAQSYAKVVVEYNEARCKSGTFPLAARFVEVNQDNQQLSDAWSVIADLFLEDSNVFLTARSGKDHVTVARGFLERTFARFMDKTITTFPKDALLGGRPTVIDRVRAFANVLMSRLPEESNHLLEYDNGVPVFAMMFYLVRTGYWQEALLVGRDNEKCAPMTTLITLFLDNNCQLPANHRAQVQSEYAQRQLTENDPFRMTLLKVLGRCDVKRKSGHPLVIQTSEDYLWLQLWLIGSGRREGSSEDIHSTLDSAYTLSDLQKLIVQFGPKHFSGPLIYFQALLLTRQYERAIAYLYVYERVDAIHYAIALHSLLKTSDSMVCSIVPSLSAEEDNSGVLSKEGDVYVLLFAKMMQRYAQQVQSIDKSLAMHYALLGTLTDTKIDILPFIGSDYEYWFGRIKVDGTRESGKLDAFSGLLAKPITELIASASERAENVHDRIHLLSLAGQWTRILDILIDTLLGDEDGKEDVCRLLQSMLEFYKTAGIQVDTKDALRAIQLYSLKSLIKNAKWLEAISLAEEHFIDFNLRTIKLPARFKTDYLAFVLESYLGALLHAFHASKQYALNDPMRQTWMQSAVDKAKAILVMVAREETALKREQMAKLAQLANQIV